MNQQLAKNKSRYTVHARLFYEVNRLLVKSEVLGASVPVSQGEVHVEIKFPCDDHPDFDPEELADIGIFDRDCLKVNGECFSEVKVLLVCVRLSSPPSVLEDNLVSNAETAIAEFIDWHRVKGQSWLGLFGQKPKEILQARRCLDADTNQPLTYAVAIDVNELFQRADVKRAAALFFKRATLAVTPGSLRDIAARMVKGDRPALAELLLADALYFADRAHPDLARALIFSAIACECKVKDTLVSKVHPSKRALVDCLFNHPHDFSMPVLGLFHKAMKAALGQSLHESNKPLFLRIDKLFQARNKLAHGGVIPQESVLDYVQAATQAFEWLDRIPAEP